MVKYLIEKHRINPLAIDETGIQMNYGDAQIDVRGDFRRAIFDMDRPVYVTGTRFTFYVPFTGDSDLFRCKPSTSSLSLPTATVRSNELIFTHDMTNDRDSDVGEMFKRDLNTTQVHAKRVNTDVGRFNGALTENAVQRLNARREKLLKDRDLVASIGFPLRRRQDPPSTFVVPDVKRRITPRKPAASAEPFSPEPALGTDDYEHILSVLSNMVEVMERSPSAFKDMNEEDLRTHFLVQLNGQYEGQATGETFNYEGKTDILIRADGRNIFVAECKFWDGSSRIDESTGPTAWVHSLARHQSSAFDLQPKQEYVRGFRKGNQDRAGPSKLQGRTSD